MLLKALEEVAAAPNAMMAAEMAVIRLTHVADLPSPEELVRKLQNAPAPAPGTRSAPVGSGAASSAPVAGRPVSAAEPALDADQALARFPTFDHVVELIRANRDVKLLVEVEGGVRLARYSPGRIEFEPAPAAAPDLSQRLGSALQRWTGNRWAVSIVSDGGAPTIAEVRDADVIAMKEQAAAHPLVQAVMAQFPKAQITRIRTPEDIAAEAQEDALPEVDDEWDPFEEE
jgi:DNA polymerase-3 subunit gamma/tau